MLGCLRALDAELRERGSGLVVRHGRPERELAALAREAGRRRGLLDERRRAVRPRPRRAGHRCAARGRRRGAAARRRLLVDVGRPRTRAGARSRVFSPFLRAWTGRSAATVHRAPRAMPALPPALDRGAVPALDALGCADELAAPVCAPGEAGGARRARALARGGRSTRYARRNDAPRGRDLAAVAVPALGLPVGARVEERAARAAAPARRRSSASSPGATSTRTCCCTIPATRATSTRSALRRARVGRRRRAARGVAGGPDRLPARRRRDAPAARDGLDAQPRPPRRRLVPDEGPAARLARGRGAGSCAAARRRRGAEQRQLAVDRLGRRRPGAGLPAHATTRRCQQERFDPDGAYVRRWVPELRGVPCERLAEPWAMSDEEQRRAGCVIGRDYPAPIVDHAPSAAGRWSATGRWAERVRARPRDARADRLAP